jgi:hypothetical protein
MWKHNENKTYRQARWRGNRVYEMAEEVKGGEEEIGGAKARGT